MSKYFEVFSDIWGTKWHPLMLMSLWFKGQKCNTNGGKVQTDYKMFVMIVHVQQRAESLQLFIRAIHSSRWFLWSVPPIAVLIGRKENELSLGPARHMIANFCCRPLHTVNYKTLILSPNPSLNTPLVSFSMNPLMLFSTTHILPKKHI